MSVSPLSPVMHTPMAEPPPIHNTSFLDPVAPDEMPAQVIHGESKLPPQQRQHYPVPTPKAFLPPSAPPKDSKSRRWSLSGLFKDRRGSLTGSNNNDAPIPTPQPSSNRQDRNRSSHEAAPPMQPPSSSSSSASSSHSGDMTLSLPPISKRTSRDSPPSSQGSSRRSSLVDIPKFLSSLRRGSTSTNDSHSSPVSSYPPSRLSGFMGRSSVVEDSLFGGAGGALGRKTSRENESLFRPSSMEDEDSEGHDMDEECETVFQGEDDPTLGPNVVARLATPKPLPKGSYPSNKPRKSILKKCPASNGSSTAAAGAGAGQAQHDPMQQQHSQLSGAHGPNANSSDILSSASVHPMATELGPHLQVPASSHRANLVTHSPVPNHQQQQQHLHQFQKAQEGHPSLHVHLPTPPPPPTSLKPAHPHSIIPSLNHSYGPDSPHPLDNSRPRMPSTSTTATPGNGGAAVNLSAPAPMHLRPQAMGDPYARPNGCDPFRRYEGGDDQLMMMLMNPNSYANDTMSHSHGYVQPQSAIGDGGVHGGSGSKVLHSRSGSDGSSGTKGSYAVAAALGTRPRIGFLSTVEIIPAHRKSDYNRRSDKNATFRVLTPDMKGEIRDELNAYKMREMAVHVESMGNTAFH